MVHRHRHRDLHPGGGLRRRKHRHRIPAARVMVAASIFKPVKSETRMDVLLVNGTQNMRAV
jgi:hypothetical protein